MNCDPEGEAMHPCSIADPSQLIAEVAQLNWYAVQTRARHEKVVAERFRQQGLNTFLPLVSQVRRWSDRKKTVQLPLFSCYVFVRSGISAQDRLRVCRVEGVSRIVGNRGEGIPIPESQIEAVRSLTLNELSYSEHPFLKIGQRVRIRSGALNGVEGILTGRNGDATLVVSINAIQRSLAVRIEGYDVEPA